MDLTNEDAAEQQYQPIDNLVRVSLSSRIKARHFLSLCAVWRLFQSLSFLLSTLEEVLRYKRLYLGQGADFKGIPFSNRQLRQ